MNPKGVDASTTGCSEIKVVFEPTNGQDGVYLVWVIPDER